jgi:hypothetical protein
MPRKKSEIKEMKLNKLVENSNQIVDKQERNEILKGFFKLKTDDLKWIDLGMTANSSGCSTFVNV